MNALARSPSPARARRDEILNIAIQILEQKALFQQDPDQDEDEEPLDDQAEYDSVYLLSWDSVAVLANALGDIFMLAFQMFNTKADEPFEPCHLR